MFSVNIILSGFINGITLFCHFTYLVERRNKLFTPGSLFYMYFTFVQKNIYPFYGYLSKFIFLLAWQDNDEKPCLTLSHEFSWHIHQPEDKVIWIQSFIWVLTFFLQTIFYSNRRGKIVLRIYFYALLVSQFKTHQYLVEYM